MLLPPRRSPLVKFALPRFEQSFSDLLSVRRQIDLFDQALIEDVFEQIMWFERTERDYEEFERTARAAYHFLEQGSQTKHKSVAQAFLVMADKIIPAMNRCVEARREAEKAKDGDADIRIKKYLEYYKTMYEGLIPVACGPVVLAFALAKGIKDKAFVPAGDGKINPKVLNKMEKWLVYPENRLSRGLNSHVRNAYAHESYKILDDAQVQLWDVDLHNPKRSWGPEVWHLDRIIKQCDHLWVNALGIVCALALYDVNNRSTMEAHGWTTRPEPPSLRRHELEMVVSSISNRLGFRLEHIAVTDGRVGISLSTQLQGIDQEAKLMLGGDTWVDLYKVKMWYEERRVIDQLTIMLYRLAPYFETLFEVSVDVASPDKTPLGRLVTDFDTLIGLRLPNAKAQTVDKIRHVFRQDTLGGSMTFVEMEGTPRFVGRVPAARNRVP